MATVLDAAAFINAEALFGREEDFYTVRDVLEELRDVKSRSLADAAISAGKLTVLEPEKKNVDEVRKAAESVGSAGRLSDADVKVLALALELGAKIITDDYTVQNLAAHLGLEYEGVMRGKIAKKRVFKRKPPLSS